MIIPVSAKSRVVWRALYGVALLLVVSPLLDLIGSIWPLRFGEVGWRFGAVGLLTNTLVTPIVGLALATVVAMLLEQWRVVKTLAIVDLVAAGLLVLVLALFALDYLQLRTGVQPAARGTYDLAAYRAIVNALLAAAVLAWLGTGGWRAAQRQPRDERAPNDRGLIVGKGTDQL